MSKVIAIAGVGPGISLAAAKKFGQQGFKVALISRTESKLKQYAADLATIGVRAEAFPADIHNVKALEGVYSDIQAKQGPITVLLWNEYSHIFDPVLTQSVDQLDTQFKSLTSMVRSIQLVSAQQEKQPENKPATIITGGTLALTEREELHPIIAQLNFNVPASIAAAKHSLAATLRHTLQPKGIRVREVMVTKTVKGSAIDGGQPETLDPAIIAEAFWKQYTEDDAPWIRYV